MGTIRPDRVAIYIRWSTDDQATGTTLEVQREGCLHYVHSQGWDVRDDLVFIDDGWSGGSLDRPALSRLRAAVRAGGVDCTVVLKIDRISRNIVDATQLVLREWQGRCSIKSVLEPIDTTTDLGRMIFGILAMFADFERSTIRERTLAGKVRRIRAGQQMHGAPAYGYMPHPTEKGRWLENPEEAPVVRRIFDLASQGESAGSIVRRLNGEGMATRAGRAWSLRTLTWLLHNRTYVGEVRYGLTARSAEATGESGSGRGAGRVRHAEPLVVVATQAAPALVTREVFDRAEAGLTARRLERAAVGSRALGSPHLLVGIAQCAGCGAAIVFKAGGRRVTAAQGRDRENGYYVCAGARAGTCGGSGAIPATGVEGLIETHFLHVLGLHTVPPAAFAAAAQTEGRVGVVLTAMDAALSGVRTEQARLGREEERLMRAARSGELPPATLATLHGSLLRDRSAAAARETDLHLRLHAAHERANQLARALARLPPQQAWNLLSVAQRRRLIRQALAHRITLWRPKGGRAVHIRMCWALPCGQAASR